MGTRLLRKLLYYRNTTRLESAESTQECLRKREVDWPALKFPLVSQIISLFGLIFPDLATGVDWVDQTTNSRMHYCRESSPFSGLVS